MSIEKQEQYKVSAALSLEQLGITNSVLLFPVSRTRLLPKNFPKDSAPVPLATLENGKQVADLVLEPAQRLLEEARALGLNPHLLSGFRSIADQKTVFQRCVEEEKAKGLSPDEAIKRANTYSARPGYSEHHLGTALDILSSPDEDTEQEQYDIWDRARMKYNSGLYLWLRENAHKFGFVLSYPTGSESIELSKPGSGYPSAEPWHIRFVGTPISRTLFEHDYLNPETDLTLNNFLKVVQLNKR